MSADLKLMRKRTCFSITTFLFEDSKTSTSGTHPRGSGWGDLSKAPFTPWDPAWAAGCFAASTWRACTSVLQEGEDGDLWPTASSSCEQLRQQHSALTGTVCFIHRGWLDNRSNRAENTAPGASVPGCTFCGRATLHGSVPKHPPHLPAQQTIPGESVVLLFKVGYLQ